MSPVMSGTSLGKQRGVTLPRLSDEFRNSLELATKTYRTAMDNPFIAENARNYLLGRGIDTPAIERYRLGVVDGSIDDHRDYTGMIAIPYITKLGGVVSLKFRQPHQCGDSCQHAKYITPYPTRIYNPLAFDKADRLGYVAITEGELDALVLDQHCDIPAVGIPGVETWRQHKEWRELFRGYSRVFIFYDIEPDKNMPDGKVRNPGRELADAIQAALDNSHRVTLSSGKDVSEAFPVLGREGIRRAAGV